MRTVDNRLMVLAISTRNAEKILRDTMPPADHPDYQSQKNALDSLAVIATELEKAARSGEEVESLGSRVEGEGPSDGEMLEWVMEHTDAGYRVAGVRGVRWLDPRDGEEHLTRGKDYSDAITKAKRDCDAIELAEQSAEATT